MNYLSEFDFAGKSVIITGGGTGIGFEIAKTFYLNEAKVCIVGRRKDIIINSMEEIKKENLSFKNNIMTICCDMSDSKSVKKMFYSVENNFDKINILINNCSTWSLEKINKINDKKIDDHYNNIIKSTILGTKFASKTLSKSGIIINIGSFAGILPMKNGSIYSSFKSSIQSFTKSSAQELGPLGIRVNCIIPGVIRTPMTSNYIDDNYDNIIKPIPLGRVGKCEEIASAILFLCSDMATYITGAILEVTGGKYSTQQ